MSRGQTTLAGNQRAYYVVFTYLIIGLMRRRVEQLRPASYVTAIINFTRNEQGRASLGSRANSRCSALVASVRPIHRFCHSRIARSCRCKRDSRARLSRPSGCSRYEVVKEQGKNLHLRTREVDVNSDVSSRCARRAISPRSALNIPCARHLSLFLFSSSFLQA